VDSSKIVDGSVSTADIGNLQVTTGKLADGAVTSPKLAGGLISGANLLVNGGFEIWQRGNGPFTANSVYSADRWNISLGGTSSMSVSRNTANADTGSGVCAEVTYTHNAQSFLNQKLEDTSQLSSRTLSWSMRVRSNTASAVRLQIYHTTSTLLASSSYHTGGSVYQTLVVTGTLPAGVTNVYLSVSMEASGTFDLDNSMLVAGSLSDYVPLHPADELARCLRYCQRWNGSDGIPLNVGSGYIDSPTNCFISIPLQARMGGVPTLTVSAAGHFRAISAAIAATCSAVPGYGISSSGAGAQPTIAGATTGQGAILQINNSSGWLQLEYNP
jgi:hypothetical protein